MNKYIQTLTNSRGDVLPGDRLQVVTGVGAGVDIFADANGTRFTDAEGNVVNYATSDLNGLVEFYWEPASEQVLQWLDPSGNLRRAFTDFSNSYLIDELVGDLPQSRITDLVDDLSAKTPVADLASSDADKGAALVGTLSGNTAQVEIAQRNHFVAASITGGSDVAAALQAKIDASYSDANRSVNLREGKYLLEDTITINQGVAIIGNGSQGSNVAFGTGFDINHAGDAFVWDGNGGAFDGTGGGMRNTMLLKRTGVNGGAAIKLTAVDDDHRPGEMWFHNILAYGSGTGTFDYGLYVDGSNADTAGTRGIRHVHMNKVRVASCTTKAVRLKQVTHFFAHGLAIDSGGGGTNTDIDISGKNERILLSSVDSIGGLTIVANDANNFTLDFHLSGYLGGAFVNNDTATTGVLNCSFGSSGTVLVNKSAGLKCITNLNTDVMLSRASPSAAVTGNGGAYTVVWDTENRDRGNNVSGSVTVVRAKCAGTYGVSGKITFSEVDAACTDLTITVLHTLAAGGSVSYTTVLGGIGGRRTSGNFLTVPFAEKIGMAFDDTVSVIVTMSGAAGNTVKVYGSSPTIYTVLCVKYEP